MINGGIELCWKWRQWRRRRRNRERKNLINQSKKMNWYQYKYHEWPTMTKYSSNPGGIRTVNKTYIERIWEKNTWNTRYFKNGMNNSPVVKTKRGESQKNSVKIKLMQETGDRWELKKEERKIIDERKWGMKRVPKFESRAKRPFQGVLYPLMSSFRWVLSLLMSIIHNLDTYCVFM